METLPVKEPELPLTGGSPRRVPLRPNRYDPAIIKAAATTMLPALRDWCKQAGDDTDTDDEDMLKALEEAIENNYDGYEVAQALDRHGYSPDAKLVEEMDNVTFAKSDAYRAACAAWVHEYEVRPLAVGLLVRWPGERKEKPGGVGKVIENHKDGTATVAFPDLGHGIMKGGCCTHGSIIAWEELVPEPGQEELIASGPLVYVEPPPKPPTPVAKTLGGMFTRREQAMLTALHLIAHATAMPGTDDDGGYHENAHQLATEAIAAATGEPLPAKPVDRVVGGPFEWADYGEGVYNPEWSGYTVGHYVTGAPEHGWVLYSQGNGCWQQRTKPVLAPEIGAQPKRIKGEWFWIVPAKG